MVFEVGRTVTMILILLEGVICVECEKSTVCVWYCYSVSSILFSPLT